MVTNNRHKLHCAERELALRLRVYIRLIARGKMTPDDAQREIELMRAIADDYRAAVAEEEPEFALNIETRKTVRDGR
jgi:hypothetical protein